MCEVGQAKERESLLPRFVKRETATVTTMTRRKRGFVLRAKEVLPVIVVIGVLVYNVQHFCL